LPVEPARGLGPLLLLACIVLGVSLRRHLAGVVLSMALGGIAVGFTVAQERTSSVAAPVLERATGIIRFEGRIVEVEPMEKGERLVLDNLRLPRLRYDGPIPQQVRVRLQRSDPDLHAGQQVALRGALLPPPMPAAPGAFDFPRQAWFKQLGAVGFAIGMPEVLPDPAEEGWRETMRLWLANTRHALTLRIVGAIDNAGIEPGTGATAAALITAERGPVPPEVLQAYRDSGLAHILVIAGMHMSMVAGLVFVAIRGILAAIPPIALRYPIKKWTAAAALVITFCYLVISGAPVPTQRAFIMNAIVLLAVLIDREAISLRSITWAALAVLLVHPEALTGPSFQMSFAAVYGLIAGYEVLGPKMTEWRRRSRGGWSTPAFYVAGILLTTQIAGSATAVYTLFHFNRYASYSLLGNFLAVPVVGFWVMPSALLAFCLMPFGLDGWGWQMMGWGIVVVSHIARWVSGLPGATFDLPQMPVSALVLFTLGGLWLCLWRQPWRLWGLAPMAAAMLLYALHAPPDLMVDASGKLVALRGEDGSIALSQHRSGKRLRETWIKQAGEGDASSDWDSIGEDRINCDALGCLYRAHGHLVALVRRPEALIEDCGHADVVVVPVEVRLSCPSARLFIDGAALRRLGTHAVWLNKHALRVETVAEWQGDRPWSHHPPPYRRPRKTAPSAETDSSAETDAEASSGAAIRPDDLEP
jgi:competence protein ComEC